MACHSGARSGARSRSMKAHRIDQHHGPTFFRGGRRRQVERLKRLFVALIEDDTDARVDNLVTLNEQGIVLGLSVRVDLETGEPGRTLEVIDQPHSGNFEVADRRHIGDDRPDVVGDNAAVVRLRQVERGSGRQILDHLARSRPRSLQAPAGTHVQQVEPVAFRARPLRQIFFRSPPTASCHPPETRERHSFRGMPVTSYPAKPVVRH